MEEKRTGTGMEHVFRHIVEQSDTGFLYAENGVIRYMNRSGRNVLGITVGEGDDLKDSIENNDILLAAGMRIPRTLKGALLPAEQPDSVNRDESEAQADARERADALERGLEGRDGGKGYGTKACLIARPRDDRFIDPIRISGIGEEGVRLVYCGYRISCAPTADGQIRLSIGHNEFCFSEAYRVFVIDRNKNLIKEVKPETSESDVLNALLHEGKLPFLAWCLKDMTGLSTDQALFDRRELSEILSHLSSQGEKSTRSYRLIKERPYLVAGEKIGKTGVLLSFEDIENYNVVDEQKAAFAKKYIQDSILQNSGDYTKFFSNIIGNSSKMLKIKYLCSRVASSDSTILILGESGTGKTMMAAEIHKMCKSREGPFIQVNCTAIPESLAESEFFGYEPGAFTGALQRGKDGYFKMAEGGTIFLDEIADISYEMQMKLLEVLQNRTYFKVGGNSKETVNVRVIAATNKDLKQRVRDGLFREDLYYRINVISFRMPALREVRREIPFLCRRLIEKICGRLNCGLKSISDAALKRLMEYQWPGNVRELENVLERAVHMSEGNVIFKDQIFFDPVDYPVDDDMDRLVQIMEGQGSLKERMGKCEKEIICRVLEKHAGNRSKAREELDVGKTQFYQKLRQILEEKEGGLADGEERGSE